MKAHTVTYTVYNTSYGNKRLTRYKTQHNTLHLQVLNLYSHYHVHAKTQLKEKRLSELGDIEKWFKGKLLTDFHALQGREALAVTSAGDIGGGV